MPGIETIVDANSLPLGSLVNPLNDLSVLSNGGAPGSNNYDGLRSLSGLGYGTAVISSGGTSTSTTIVLASAVGLVPGSPIRLSGGGGSEVVYATLAYVAGSTTVPLQSAIVTGTRLNAEWPMFASSGPGVNAVLPFGAEASAQMIVDPTGGANSQAVYRVRRAIFETTVLSSSARTTTQTVTLTNINADFLHILLNVTNVAAAPSITLTINAIDPTSGVAYPLLVGVAVTAAGMNAYRVGPGLLAAANAIANDMVPKSLQIVVTANNSNSCTYSVGAVLGGV
ncbi:MAG: hypothetical protein H0X37_15320 [Herpetosiphonaceae bacterium]|nr:hypothetical protein [Herpetosiphonaceae bacterium]